MDPNFAKEDGERGKIKMFLTVFACSNNFVVVVQHINKDEIMFLRRQLRSFGVSVKLYLKTYSLEIVQANKIWQI